MKLKSPHSEPLCVSLTNGTGLRIPPEGRDVPQEFLKAAFAEGAIPAEVDAGEFGEKTPEMIGDDKMDLLVSGIKTMLTEKPEDFTGAGLPNRKVLSGIVGWNVSVQEVSAAMAKVNEEAGQ